MQEQTRRTKKEMFEVLLTDAVAAMYPATGLRADHAVNVPSIRKALDKAGLLADPVLPD